MDNENYQSSPCVGSGLCCKTGPCPYGEWLSAENKCKYLENGLTDNGVTIYRCGRYEYIKQQPGNEWVPAFGAGCCMSLFNKTRSNIIKEIKNGNEQVIKFLKLSK